MTHKIKKTSITVTNVKHLTAIQKNLLSMLKISQIKNALHLGLLKNEKIKVKKIWYKGKLLN